MKAQIFVVSGNPEAEAEMVFGWSDDPNSRWYKAPIAFSQENVAEVVCRVTVRDSWFGYTDTACTLIGLARRGKAQLLCYWEEPPRFYGGSRADSSGRLVEKNEKSGDRIEIWTPTGSLARTLGVLAVRIDREVDFCKLRNSLRKEDQTAYLLKVFADSGGHGTRKLSDEEVAKIDRAMTRAHREVASENDDEASAEWQPADPSWNRNVI